jgi:ferric-dicitrate binding protein FerR (iron transport regulator)
MVNPLGKKQLLDLIDKYVAGTASEKERLFVEQYCEHFDFRDHPDDGLSELKRQELEKRLLGNIHARIRPAAGAKPDARRRRIWTRAAAAAVLLLAATGAVTYLVSDRTSPSPVAAVAQPDVSPGTNGAILKLPGGKSIVLDTLSNGTVRYGARNSISKTDSMISFAAASGAGRIEYYTLITPRARHEQLTLPDGSKVWLNAASSIRFPSAFAKGSREVEISGEAYFEVSKDRLRPFVVKVKDLRIEVLGTHFNVLAYDDDPSVKTTLLEGSVRVVEGSNALLLAPGQQALVDGQGSMTLVKDVNLSETVAWKNNLFWFENDDVRTVMARLSRWYDVDIRIEGRIPDLFTGSIPRNLPFSKVFEVLQKTGSIHYRMKNSDIIVSP